MMRMSISEEITQEKKTMKSGYDNRNRDDILYGKWRGNAATYNHGQL